MHPAIRSLAAAILVAAIATPSFASPRSGMSNRGRDAIERDGESVLARESATVDRQEKMWTHLSASICVGCITAANRVAPSTYERTAANPIAGAKVIAAGNVEHIKTILSQNPTPRRFVNMKKRVAKLHRRDRRRLAARAHRLRLAMRVKRHAAHLAAFRAAPATRPHRIGAVQAIFLPVYEAGMESRVYRIPVDQPWAPQDDGRIFETFRPVPPRFRRS